MEREREIEIEIEIERERERERDYALRGRKLLFMYNLDGRQSYLNFFVCRAAG